MASNSLRIENRNAGPYGTKLEPEIYQMCFAQGSCPPSPMDHRGRRGQHTRKWHKDKQSDDRNDDHHDDNLLIVEALAADHERGGNIAVPGCLMPALVSSRFRSPEEPPNPDVEYDKDNPGQDARRVPDTSSTFPIFATEINNASKTRLRLETRSSTGLTAVQPSHSELSRQGRRQEGEA